MVAFADSAEGLNTEGPQQCDDAAGTRFHAGFPMPAATRQIRPSVKPFVGMAWQVLALLQGVIPVILWDAVPTLDLIRMRVPKHGAGAAKACNGR
jgi:hypothetical protein